MDYRIEHDSMGEVKVPADKYWGAQTERSHENFPIGVGLETMPREITRAFGVLKLAAARANYALKPEKMTDEKLAAIEQAATEVMEGKLFEHFPLVVWQTGSGTQSNMNANEVIANRGNEIAGKKLLHPNDDINMSQSSNDTFPTAMHIAAVEAIEEQVLPAVDKLTATLRRLEAENEGVVKSGRTHLQDATPIKFSQEISGWRSSLEKDRQMLLLSLDGLRELALGGTAVGTGLNAPKGFDVKVAQEISNITRSLKVAAKELSVPILLLSQLSRATERRENKRPMLSDLRESGAIEQDADVVLFLHREDYYAEEGAEPGRSSIIIAKQRSGPTGTIDVIWRGEQTKYMEVDFREEGA